MKRLTAILSLCLSFAAAGADFTESIMSGAFWSQTPRQFLQGLRFNRPDNTQFRIQPGNISIGSLTTGEVIITVAEEKPVALQVMVYNKGDDAAVAASLFKNTEKSTREAIEAMTGSRPRYQGAGKHGGIIKTKVWDFVWNKGIIRMESSSSGSGRDFQGEFIRLHIAPDAETLDSRNTSRAADKKQQSNHVTTEEDGTVWIKGIPMVDQGSKGYCVPATISRVLGLYGIKVDQHVLAQICDTESEKGTNGKNMLNAMNLVCKKYHTDLEILADYESIVKPLIKPYNRIAKRERKPLVSYQTYNVFSDMDPDILLQIRADKKHKVDKWLKQIKKHIDRGTPIIWNIPDHVRLIIGYNLEKQTIIYSDSWGENHARSVMPAANALAMTNGLFLLKNKQ